jgi:hypothetical protein
MNLTATSMNKMLSKTSPGFLCSENNCKMALWMITFFYIPITGEQDRDINDEAGTNVKI